VKTEGFFRDIIINTNQQEFCSAVEWVLTLHEMFCSYEDGWW